MWCKNVNCILNSINNNETNSYDAAATSASSTKNKNINNRIIDKMDCFQREKLAMHLVQCAGELIGGISPKPLWWHYAEKNFNFLQNNFQNEVVLKQLFVKCAKLLKNSDVVKTSNKKRLSSSSSSSSGVDMKDQKFSARFNSSELRRSKRPSSSPPITIADLSKTEFLKSIALVPKKKKQRGGTIDGSASRNARKTRRIANFANMPISSDLAKRVLAQKTNNYSLPEMFKLKRLEKTERHVNKENCENKGEIEYPVAFNRNVNCLHHYKMPKRQLYQNNSNCNGLMKLCKPVVVQLEQMRLDVDGRNSGGGAENSKMLIVRIGKDEKMLCDRKSAVKYLRFSARLKKNHKITYVQKKKKNEKN